MEWEKVPGMTQKEFFESIEADHAEALSISRKKNHDYSGESDPFHNFKVAAFILKDVDLSNVDKVELGLFYRECDKLARWGQSLAKTMRVADESVDDTLMDGSNYLNITRAWRKNLRKIKDILAVDKSLPHEA